MFTDTFEYSLSEEDNEIIDLATDTSREQFELFVSIDELLPSNCGIYVSKLTLHESEEGGGGGWLTPSSSLNVQTSWRLELNTSVHGSCVLLSVCFV